MSDWRKPGNCNKLYLLEKRNKAGPSRPKPPPVVIGHFSHQVARYKHSEGDEAPEIMLPRKKFTTIEALLLEKNEKPGNEKLETKFKHDFLDKLAGTFQEQMDKMNIIESRKKVSDQELPQVSSEMLEFRMKLPCYKMKDQVLKKIRDHQIVVISGETGCGKTTQIVQYVLDEALNNSCGNICNIVCTQPKRISAISVAERVAAERNEKVKGMKGMSVGYQVSNQSIRKTKRLETIMFVTTEIILEWIQDNPLLIGVSHLFLDEVNERDILSDFILACLFQIIKKRPDLKVIIMSAPLNAEIFSKYFGGAPCVHIPGSTFPVEEIYLEKILELTNFTYASKASHPKNDKWKKFITFEVDAAAQNYIKNLQKTKVVSRRVGADLVKAYSEKFNADLIAKLVHHICKHETEGAILIFVPGMEETDRAQIAVKKILTCNGNETDYIIITLHSNHTSYNKRQLFDKPKEGVRKIVIATNIAETGITIDDVAFVIDCGLLQMKTFDQKLNVSSFIEKWIAVSNARQRRDHAGRFRGGKCYKLYTSYRESTFEPYPIPEMQCTRLDQLVLKVKMLKLGSAKKILETVLDPPDERTVKLSVEILKSLRALDENEQLTPLGYQLARLQLDPQIGKMILLSALFGCVDPILSIAACLSYKQDPFSAPLELHHLLMQAKMKLSGGHKSDHYVYHAAMSGWEEANRVNEGRSFAKSHLLWEPTLRLLRKIKKQFAQNLYELQFLRTNDPKDENGNFNSKNWPLVKAIICAGLYPNIAMIVKHNKAKSCLLKIQNHPKVMLDKRSICNECSYFETPYLVYHMVLQKSDIFLHDVTLACPWTLLFFGKAFDIVNFEGGCAIRVDSLVKIDCVEKTAVLIQELKNRFDSLLADTIANPGVIDWTSEQKPPVLQAIIELITSATENK